jgi:hypothetical protein
VEINSPDLPKLIPSIGKEGVKLARRDMVPEVHNQELKKKNEKVAFQKKTAQKTPRILSPEQVSKHFDLPTQRVKPKPIILTSQKKCSPSLRNPQPVSPAMFYYAPRMKSIRVSSPPNIEGWERSLREEMRLNGRSRSTINQLLGRIQNYYDDPTITAEDYSPENEGYQPSPVVRELAESRIRRAVESIAEFFKKSGNYEMDLGRSSNGSDMMNGKLAFINTQLTKLGKDRVTMRELEEIVGLKIQPNHPIPMHIEEVELKEELRPKVVVPEIAELVPMHDPKFEDLDLADPNFDKEFLVEENIEELYLSFATWLADHQKPFPSLDPLVDAKTHKYYDRINAELREVGKFENMQIFREKALAHLDEILDDRGERFNQEAPSRKLHKPNQTEDLDDPVFRKKNPHVHRYVHLASLPGKVVSFNPTPVPTELPGNKTPFDNNGNKRVFRVMNNLPGSAVY